MDVLKLLPFVPLEQLRDVAPVGRLRDVAPVVLPTGGGHSRKQLLPIFLGHIIAISFPALPLEVVHRLLQPGVGLGVLAARAHMYRLVGLRVAAGAEAAPEATGDQDRTYSTPTAPQRRQRGLRSEHFPTARGRARLVGALRSAPRTSRSDGGRKKKLCGGQLGAAKAHY